ncbi:MAG: HAD hydrolase family protein, partial [Synergistaceae bacterium]|nr:HAD hydrolase family protein [Synergistaceae bacterium]
IEPDVPFISGNGAAIVDPDGNRVLHQKLLPVDDARRFFSFCARIGLDYCALGPEGGFFSRDGRCIDRFTNYNKIAAAAGVEEIPLRSFDDDHENALRSPIHKVLLYRLDEKERTGVEEFLRDFRGLAYTFSSATLMEVLALGVDKGYGVRELARITGFKKEEICVFGDYINDIPMFGEAGLSFAMANACEEARNATDGLTASNDRDGVALALEKYILR